MIKFTEYKTKKKNKLRSIFIDWDSWDKDGIFYDDIPWRP